MFFTFISDREIVHVLFFILSWQEMMGLDYNELVILLSVIVMEILFLFWRELLRVWW